MATPTLDKADAAGSPEPGFADSPYITVTFRVRRFNSEVSAEASWQDFQLEIDPKEIDELGGYDGAINIPLPQLEKRLGELPKDKTILTA